MISPHLIFGGQCEQAFTFYESLLDGKIVTMLTYGASPMAGQVPPEWAGKIVHAALSLGDQVLSGADALPGEYEQPRGFYVLLQPTDLAESERIFLQLAERGQVRLPIQETFWSPAFGVVVDRFGIPWEISCAQTPELR